jgi:hypothetical protein
MRIVYLEIHTKQINALYAKMNSFLELKQMVGLRIITVFHQGIKFLMCSIQIYAVIIKVP